MRVPENMAFDFSKLDRVSITACGTASYAGLTAKYWFERIARLPCDVDIASEFPLSRGAACPERTCHRGLAVGRNSRHPRGAALSKVAGQHTLAVVNVPESTIARESEMVVRTYAGPEIGVASTKAFTCQLSALAALALQAAKQRGHLPPEKEQELVGALLEAPRHMAEVLHQEKYIAQVAKDVAHSRDVLFLGRGIMYPIALEAHLNSRKSATYTRRLCGR